MNCDKCGKERIEPGPVCHFDMSRTMLTRSGRELVMRVKYTTCDTCYDIIRESMNIPTWYKIRKNRDRRMDNEEHPEGHPALDSNLKQSKG